ncbi:tetrapyrrole methylase [Sphaerosporella brunnea]|uniref:Diphthine methyl ester synthase n=1 Tax=Sphaerosporella brunnea TaxID=1250544 RepID=A0A5J5FBR7_9PEZI|nr:tetrapyrrole methylase [Sphaerosporella brunnea]
MTTPPYPTEKLHLLALLYHHNHQHKMVLYFIGLGLSNEKDITVAGLEVVKRASRVYLEAYTSILMISKEALEEFYGRPVLLADRELVESSADEILSGAASSDVAFLVVGDPFGATTHTDLLLRARSLKIPTRTIHNASIMNAIGAAGLQLYNFGQTVSMVFFLPQWRPSSFYDRVRENRAIGLHTLMLLDIKVKEQSWENMARGRKVYEPPRYMTVAECARQMLEVEEERGEGGRGRTGPLMGTVYGPNSLAVGVSRLGSEDQCFKAGTLQQLAEADLGAPLHSLVLLGSRVHELEIDFIREFAIDTEVFDKAYQMEHGKKEEPVVEAGN